MASAELPEVVVALILRLVPQKQRLQQCALVSTLWAAAARAATQSLALVLKNDSSNAGAIKWINSHGTGLTSLRLRHVPYSTCAADVQQQLLSLLPCPGLRSLELCNVDTSLQLTVNSSQLLLLSAATALTRLVLTGVTVAAGSCSKRSAAPPTNNLMALSALTALQYLEVDSRVGLRWSTSEQARLIQLPSALVPCLTQVKHLVLHDALTEVWALQQLSCLTGLCSLGIGLSRGIRYSPGVFSATEVAAALQHLGSLTALSLTDPSLFLFAEMWPNCFSAFTQLHSLQLHNTASRGFLDLAQLATLTDLQHLDIGLKHALSQAMSSDLFSWLSQIQQLTYLRLSGVLDLSLQDRPRLSAGAYAALTASSNLQHLDLSNCILQTWDRIVRGSVWQHVFAPGKLSQPRLLRLTSLQLDRCHPGLGVKSLQYLVRCCPSLQRLDLSTCTLQDYRRHGFYEGKELSVLLGLKQLTSLTVRGYSRAEAVQVLAQMTQVRELHLTLPCRWQLDGSVQPRSEENQPPLQLALLPLTRLCQLESLAVRDGSEPKLELHSTKPMGCPPDVCSQLGDLAQVEGGRAVATVNPGWVEGWLRAGRALCAELCIPYAMGALWLLLVCAFLIVSNPAGPKVADVAEVRLEVRIANVVILEFLVLISAEIMFEWLCERYNR